ncbi:MAG TPA: lysophospholipid acyltransferase family protein [Polyangia bacterium]|jgi:1-acyl-sn-glycerol-3-phosphate acyltransferase
MSGSVGATLYAIYKTAAISVPTVADALLGRLTIERGDRRLSDWSRSIVRRADVDLTVEGLHHVPRDRACVYMSNHQSHLDIPILYSVFPGTLRMVAKAELFKVPVWGRAMRAAGFVRVTRSGDRAGAVAAMRECGDAIARGVNVWIAPEGTRSLDGKIAKFKKGGFILARDSGADIVPVAIDGSRDILPKNTRIFQRGARVKVTFGAPVRVGGRELNDVVAETRAFIVGHVTEPND